MSIQSFLSHIVTVLCACILRSHWPHFHGIGPARWTEWKGEHQVGGRVFSVVWVKWIRQKISSYCCMRKCIQCACAPDIVEVWREAVHNCILGEQNGQVVTSWVWFELVRASACVLVGIHSGCLARNSHSRNSSFRCCPAKFSKGNACWNALIVLLSVHALSWIQTS